MKYLKIIRKVISNLQNNINLKKTYEFDYRIMIEFTSRNIEKITIESCWTESNIPILIIIFSIPDSFDFNFVKELFIPNKVFNKLLHYYISRYILLSLIDSKANLDIMIDSIKISLYKIELELSKLFDRYSEILDRDEFENIFLYKLN